MNKISYKNIINLFGINLSVLSRFAVFWRDSFDRNVDIEAGGRSIYNSTEVIFQERTDSQKCCKLQHKMVKTNQRF